MRDKSIFSCPQYGLPLDEAADRYVCANRHAFDRGRSGYVNLRQTARRGDTGTMLHARRRFLERGFFQPISDAINAIVVDHLKRLAASGRAQGNEAIVDVGCGDGYYLRRLSRILDPTPFRCLPLVGLDASKHAARLTAAGVRGRRCAVVDVQQGLFLRPGRAAVLLSVFAPKNPPAFADALMTGGLCLVVIPTLQHMKAVRDLITAPTIPSWKQARVEDQFAPYLGRPRVQNLTYSVRLDGDARRSWIEMGPAAWHATHEQLNRLQSMEPITTEVACTLMRFVKARGICRDSRRLSLDSRPVTLYPAAVS